MKNKLLEAINDPIKALAFLSQRALGAHRDLRYLLDGVPYNKSGSDFIEEDWDQLILLDACRYDEFERHLDGAGAFDGVEGSLEHRKSRGSMSEEFIRGNFTGRTLHDVVYVSGNPWFAKLTETIDTEVHDFVLVERDALGGETCSPERVTETARAYAERYPNKRLIVHYIQPHQPYLRRMPDGEIGPQPMKRLPGNFHFEIARSEYSNSDVIAAYRENLDLVVDEVKALLPELEGKTVVSADHGEMLGERTWPVPLRHYGHPRGIRRPEVIDVPWFVVDDGNRRRIVPEPPQESADIVDALSEDMDRHAINERLQDLGYMT